MAVRKASNGTWGAWQVTKIKGEQGQKGEPGDNGADAEMVEWETAPSVIRCSASGVPQTASVTVRAYHIKGSARVQINAEGTPSKLYVEYRVAHQSAVPGATTRPLWQKLGTSENVQLTLTMLYPTVELRVIDADGAVVSESQLDYVCDGSQGPAGTGIQGAVTRIRGAFIPGETYYDGKTEEEGTGMYWLDVVWCDNGTGTDRRYYVCRKTGTYSDSTGPTYSGARSGWEEFSYISALFTDILLANNANIKFLSGSELVILDNDGNIWGRFGAPTASKPGSDSLNPDLEGTILWTGGSSLANATFALTKSGKMIMGNLSNALLGDNSHKQIVLDPENKEIRVLSGGRMCVQIDGKTHDLDSEYGTTLSNFTREAWTDSPYTFTRTEETVMAQEINVGDAGATLEGGLFIDDVVTQARYDISNRVGQLYDYRRWSGIKVELVLIRKGTWETESVLVATDEFVFNGIYPSSGSGSLDYHPTIDPKTRGFSRRLTAGTYMVELRVEKILHNNLMPGTLAEPDASISIKDFHMNLIAGNEPKCFLGANGLLVANSTQDYFKAGMVNGEWVVEAVQGGKGLRIKGGRIQATDNTGVWRNLKLEFE